jgi:alpha-galactosidase
MESDEKSLARRDFILLLGSLAPSSALLQRQPVRSEPGFQNKFFQISILGSRSCLWSYRLKASGKEYRVAPPVFNVDHHRTPAALTNIRATEPPSRLRNGATEYRYEGTFAGRASLSLAMMFQAAEDCPIVRFSYILRSTEPHALTRPMGHDDLIYLGLALDKGTKAKEIRLANFSELTHSYLTEEVKLDERSFEDGISVMGPILISSDGRCSVLVAYEHGSQVPDAFIQYKLHPDYGVTLQALKGNYLSGQVVDGKQHYQTVWFEAGAVAGNEDRLAAAFRNFVLNYMTENLDSMNGERILKEIDVAHQMGIDVYVLDTGWYGKTGEWSESRKRFPDGLKSVKEKLDSYGMQLGLWFGPTSAAVSSRALEEHRDCIMSWQGVEREPRPVWETEASYHMCLVSRYGDAFAERLIQLSKEIGVTYFKWDGIGQYGCDSPHHWHGDESNTPRERAESYAFQLVREMGRIADHVASACPGAIVDYDVTEAGRAVGLGFLASGRFFLINNGPYYPNYDIPFDRQHQNSNVFFHPGPARTWICRSPLSYDKWIPSILFLTHYYPDDPIEYQEVSMASLILGQNGIWGDLLQVSSTGVNFIGETLARYKQIRDDMAASNLVMTGCVSGSPEFHEKINSKTGRGAVVLFATSKGEYSYVTSRRVAAEHWASRNVSVRKDRKGRAKLDFTLDKPGAKLVFFGVE